MCDILKNNDPELQDIDSLKIAISYMMKCYTETRNGTERKKENYFRSICELTPENCQKHLHRNELACALHLMNSGYKLYSIKANEDVQWCDIICWSKKAKKWFLVELKCNHNDPLLKSRGQFTRLGTITNERDLIQYFRKGLRLKNIAQEIGIGGIKLIYEGKLRSFSDKRGMYDITYGENGIGNVVKIENNFEQILCC